MAIVPATRIVPRADCERLTQRVSELLVSLRMTIPTVTLRLRARPQTALYTFCFVILRAGARPSSLSRVSRPGVAESTNHISGNGQARPLRGRGGRLCGKALAATPGYRRGAHCAPVSPILFCGREMRAPTTPFFTQSGGSTWASTPTIFGCTGDPASLVPNPKKNLKYFFLPKGQICQPQLSFFWPGANRGNP
jgi:hypothetical protein